MLILIGDHAPIVVQQNSEADCTAASARLWRQATAQSLPDGTVKTFCVAATQ